MSDPAIDAIARRQHGAFSRPQALAVGLSSRMIQRRISAGDWIPLDRGVYALASHPFSWLRQAMAATLAVPDAALSGPSAAVLRRLDDFRPGRIEIVVPRKRNGVTRLATVRHSDFAQAAKVNGIPCLTVAHTILSLAGRTAPERLDRVVDSALGRRFVTLEELQDRFVTWVGYRRPGVADLRRILEAKGNGWVPPTTELEHLLRAFLAAPGLPEFGYEIELPWWPAGQGRVDAYSAEHRLIVEADGRGWHTRERDFVKDRRRDNLATANGHATLRFTFVDLLHYVDENRLLVEQTLATR